LSQLDILKEKSNKKINYEVPVIVKVLLKQTIYFLIGLVVSKGMIFDKYAPFGTAMMASVPYKNMWALLFGESLGYILPSSIGGSNVRYMASTIAAMSMRWAFNDLKKVKKSSFYAPIVTFIPIISTAIVMESANGISIKILISLAIESLIASVSAFFFSRTISLSGDKQKFRSLNQYEIVCSAMTACVFIMSLSIFFIANLSIGRIIATVAVLFFSYHLGITGGSIAGIASGIAFSLSSGNFSYISGAYAFGGMVCSILLHMGKIAIVIALLVSHIIIYLQTNDLNIILQGVFEVIIGASIFLLIPQSIGDNFSKFLLKPPDKNLTKELKSTVSMRLEFASKAMSKVADCVSQVSKKLSKIENEEKTTFEDYIEKINNVCNLCNLKTLCWNKRTEETLKVFENAYNTFIKEKRMINKIDFPKDFKCHKPDEILRATSTFRKDQYEKESAQQRVGEIKSFVTEQFSSLSEILSELADEFNEYEKMNNIISQQIFQKLTEEGAKILQVNCRINKFNRYSVEIEALNSSEEILKKPFVKKTIEKLCGKNFDKPCIEIIDNRIRMQISQIANLKVKINAAQHICNNGTLCGDNFFYFEDGLGKMVVVLSDGMGTGGRAAVDGAMASGIFSRLVKAGIGFDCALKVTNFALLSKSDDESLATLDIVCIDLFTGRTEFMKAGAPLTLVRKKSKIIKVDLESLPIGIFKKAEFMKQTSKLEENDMIVMFSDGAISSDEKWLEREIFSFKEENIKNFSQYLVDEAKNHQEPGYDDDITVITICLAKNKKNKDKLSKTSKDTSLKY
jgi:stage II sporulation protein E